MHSMDFTRMLRREVEPTSLPLDLLPRPSCCLDGTLSVITICAHFLDHLSEPIFAESCGELAVRKGFGKITGYMLALRFLLQQSQRSDTHPMTPIELRISGSDRFAS
jgi:hypothetical protein